jgi:hypothetical protein
MSTKAWKTTGIILLIGTTALYGTKTVSSIVSASHLVGHCDEVKETRVHLMRDHKLYIEEITQQSSSPRTCKMSLAVLPEPAFQQIEKLIESREFETIRNRQNVDEMKGRECDIWHIAFREGPTHSFVFKPPQSPPPRSFVAWFDEARRLQPYENIQLKAESCRCTLFSQEMAYAWQH